jgi:hypothetical protein
MRRHLQTKIFIAAWVGCCLLPSSLHAVPTQLPDGRTLEKVDFERHVHAILNRQGCNAGVCHGSERRRGVLSLSLFAGSPGRDFAELTRSSRGRYLNFAAPEQSLLLLKPTRQLSHEGGERIVKGSWEYQVLRQWIAEGAKWAPGAGEVTRLDVTPKERIFTGPGESQEIKVVATFADGSLEDVSCFSDFRIPQEDEAAAVVSRKGVARALQPGVAWVMVFYRGHVRPVRLVVAGPKIDDYPQLPEVNFIDREVLRQLRPFNIVPSGLSSDEMFLRRVYIDLIGSLPAPQAVRNFVADKDPDKRVKKIDELLAHPRHASLWASKLSDITGNAGHGMNAFGEHRERWSQLWHDWLRKRLADNMPYDQIVKGVLCADSREGDEPAEWLAKAKAREQAIRKGQATDYVKRQTLDLFWWSGWGGGPEYLHDMAERTASAFLGLRLDCARCHNHPLGGLTQADVRGYANLFGRVRVGRSPQTKQLAAEDLAHRKRVYDAERAAILGDHERRREALPWLLSPQPPKQFPAALTDLERARDADLRTLNRTFDAAAAGKALDEVWLSAESRPVLTDPETGADLPARFLGGEKLESSGDPRAALFRRLTARDHPYFARNVVNLVWTHYFGLGLMEPTGTISDADFSHHPRLLDALAKDFIDHGFDFRRLERTILLSRTYQLSSEPNETNKHDRVLFARAYPHRPSGRVLGDMIADVLDTPLDFGAGLPKGTRAIEVTAVPLNFDVEPPAAQAQQRAEELVRIFGRSETVSRCESPWTRGYLGTGGYHHMAELVDKSQRASAFAIDRRSDAELVDELFLIALSHVPPENYRKTAIAHLEGTRPRRQAISDILWALINTKEFVAGR